MKGLSIERSLFPDEREITGSASFNFLFKKSSRCISMDGIIFSVPGAGNKLFNVVAVGNFIDHPLRSPA